MRRGFTLMELIVAVGVFALMGVLILGIVSGMFAVSRDTDDVVEANHMARVAIERMTRDLSQAYLSLNQGIEERTKTLFVGKRDSLLFCYMGNIPVRAGGLETDQGVIEYRLGGTSDDRQGRKLVRRFKPVLDDDPEDGGEELVIASGIKKLRFEYYDREEESWESDWQADDPLSNQEPGFILPSRVKIYMELYDQRDLVYTFETQTSIYVQKPLLFGKATSKNEAKKTLEKALKNKRPGGGIPLPTGGSTGGGR